MNKEKKEQISFNIDEMSENDMVDLLIDLRNTIYWQAIKKYNKERDNLLIGGLVAVDPLKNPSTILLTQGTRIGLYDMENGIEEEYRRREEKIKEKSGK